MSFKSFLSHVGGFFATAVKDIQKYAPTVIADAQAVTAAAAPVITLAFPGVGTAIVAGTTLVLNEVVSVEEKFAAAGQPTGSGPQKLATVIGIIGPALKNLLASEGLPTDDATVTNWINAVVGFLNGIPAAQNPTVTGATATVTVS